jgi:hypothetical protein
MVAGGKNCRALSIKVSSSWQKVFLPLQFVKSFTVIGRLHHLVYAGGCRAQGTAEELRCAASGDACIGQQPSLSEPCVAELGFIKPQEKTMQRSPCRTAGPRCVKAANRDEVVAPAARTAGGCNCPSG